MGKAGIYTICIALLGLLAYDIHINGSLEKSSTGRFLKDSGCLKYTKLVLEEAKKGSDNCVRWAKMNVPVYYNEVSTYLKPFIQLFYELTLIFINQICYLFNMKLPDFDAQLVSLRFQQVIEVAKNSTLIVSDHLKSYTLYAVNFAKQNIFVGNMSPENLRRFTMEALNTTQVYASSTLHWVYEKFQSL